MRRQRQSVFHINLRATASKGMCTADTAVAHPAIIATPPIAAAMDGPPTRRTRLRKKWLE
jgi:hypothetical protein